MTTTLVHLLAQARDVGLTIEHDGAGIRVTGPRTAGPLVHALQERRQEVLTVVDYLTGRAAALDWQRAEVSRQTTCLLCRRPAYLRDPYDHQPMHKTCAEAALDTQPSGDTR